VSAISFDLRVDEISPSLQTLASDELRKRCLMAAGTVISSLAQRSFDEPNLRPAPWPARKSGGSHPLLIKSGTLRQSIHLQIESGNSVRIGTPVVYGAIHQLGSDKKKGRGSGVPPRPFFPVLNDQLTGNAKAMIKEAVDILVGKAGG
jgi:phage gpG-like protein